MNYHGRTVRSYPQDGRTGLFETPDPTGSCPALHALETNPSGAQGPPASINSPLRLIPPLREKVNMAKHRPNPRVIARDHQPPTRTNYPRACFFPSSPAAYLTTHLLPSTPPNKQYKANNKQQKMASTPYPHTSTSPPRPAKLAPGHTNLPNHRKTPRIPTRDGRSRHGGPHHNHPLSMHWKQDLCPTPHRSGGRLLYKYGWAPIFTFIFQVGFTLIAFGGMVDLVL